MLSKEVYEGYLNDLDPAKRFLTNADLDQLKIYETQVDDQIRMRTFEFFDHSVKLIDESYVRAEKIFTDIIKHPFDFKKDEEIELDYEKRLYANDAEELKEAWRKYLKYELLSRVHDKIESQEKEMLGETSDDV